MAGGSRVAVAVVMAMGMVVVLSLNLVARDSSDSFSPV
jgi:hypothetical protein